jgi:hypothetical protein
MERSKENIGFHLAKWDMITKPKDLGGWGIRNLDWFGRALAAKSLWRAFLDQVCGVLL